MAKKRIHLLGVGLLVVVLLALLGGWLDGMSVGAPGETEVRRTFVIRFPEGLHPDLERPAVEFSHDLHTRALGKDCEMCHAESPSGEGLSYRVYESLPPGASVDEVADAYHEYCGSCHEERDAGPRTCGECHVKKKSYVNAVWHSPELDLREHNKHVEFEEGKCDACHHDRDEETGEVRYIKNHESSCRDCHKSEGVERRLTFRTVAHRRCITCHRKQEALKKDAGPIECGGCHDRVEPISPLADMSDVPRLDRNQDDQLLVGFRGNMMEAVPFAHASHEKVTRNCRVCHHQTLKGCRDCHELKGAPEGGGVKLADAFHRSQSTHSCVGCHERVKKQSHCAYCHGSMPAGPTESTCEVCHSGPLPEGQTERARYDPEDLLPEDVPEVIFIDATQELLEPVEFPHLDLIHKMNGFLGDNRLASVFHGNRPVVCTACHHHSPLTHTPPACARCHQDPFDSRILFRPGLKGAYHQQCIGCHKLMDIGDYRDCRACHKDQTPLPGDEDEGGQR